MHKSPMFSEQQAEWIVLQVKEWYLDLPDLKEEMNCIRFVDDIIERILDK